jgi:hypothetical protein
MQYHKYYSRRKDTILYRSLSNSSSSFFLVRVINLQSKIISKNSHKKKHNCDLEERRKRGSTKLNLIQFYWFGIYHFLMWTSRVWVILRYDAYDTVYNACPTIDPVVLCTSAAAVDGWMVCIVRKSYVHRRMYSRTRTTRKYGCIRIFVHFFFVSLNENVTLHFLKKGLAQIKCFWSNLSAKPHVNAAQFPQRIVTASLGNLTDDSLDKASAFQIPRWNFNYYLHTLGGSSNSVTLSDSINTEYKTSSPALH